MDLNPYNQNHEQPSTQSASKRGRASVTDHHELDDIVKSNQVASNNLNKNVEEVILANEKLMQVVTEKDELLLKNLNERDKMRQMIEELKK